MPTPTAWRSPTPCRMAGDRSSQADRRRHRRDVILDNDVNLATIAERTASGETDFVYLWLGSGLGAGVDIAGRVQRGATGSAGEIGYLEVPPIGRIPGPSGARLHRPARRRPAVARLLGVATFAEALPLLPDNADALAAIAARSSRSPPCWKPSSTPTSGAGRPNRTGRW